LRSTGWRKRRECAGYFLKQRSCALVFVLLFRYFKVDADNLDGTTAKAQRSKHEVPNKMKDKITVYEKPTCTKCREMDRLLRESGIPFEKVNYYIAPLTKKKLRELLTKMNLPARAVLRTSEPIYRDLGLGKDEFTEDQIISLMIEHPDLIQRPIVERGSRAILGRPTENVRELL
jgi:arsenate reductase